MKDRIRHFIQAGFAGLYLVSHEEIRAEAVVKDVAEELGYGLWAWTLTGGLANVDTGEVDGELTDPVEAICATEDLPEKSLLMLKDFHQFLGDASQPASPLITRTLKDQIRNCRRTGKVIIIVGCVQRLPPEIERDLTVVEFDLPNQNLLHDIALGIAESASIDIDNDIITQAAEAAKGVTTTEAEDLMALSIVQEQTLNPAVIALGKANAIAKSGILEVINPKETADDIGGLDQLKQWLAKRRRAFSDEAKSFGLPVPKGLLIIGIPGTGKSLTAKAASSILQRPILKLDAGRLFAGLVGESEANLRRAIQTAEAIAPCVLWIDEIEKGLSGSRSSGTTDGGTSARVFGSFISWMQDKTSPVFVMATANDVSQLPPEFLRKGRYDEVFFVDLPTDDEREPIWRIHIKKRGRNPDTLDVRAFSKLTDGFSGAEIEQVVIDALHDCFEAGHDLDTATIITAIENTVPLSTTMKEEIGKLRKWAKTRARAAS